MTPEQVAASWARLTALAEAEGLEYHLDRTQGGSSFDAHRLIWLGAEHGIQDAVKERLLRAYFTEGEPIGEPDVLDRLALEAGLPPDEVADLLAGDRFAAEVREDEQRARLLGVERRAVLRLRRALRRLGRAERRAAARRALRMAQSGSSREPAEPAATNRPEGLVRVAATARRFFTLVAAVAVAGVCCCTRSTARFPRAPSTERE